MSGFCLTPIGGEEVHKYFNRFPENLSIIFDSVEVSIDEDSFSAAINNMRLEIVEGDLIGEYVDNSIEEIFSLEYEDEQHFIQSTYNNMILLSSYKDLVLKRLTFRLQIL